jgi:hypothetical protein
MYGLSEVEKINRDFQFRHQQKRCAACGFEIGDDDMDPAGILFRSSVV